MFLIFFCIWIVLNGKLTLEIALFGIAISLLVFLFLCKFMEYSIKKELAVIRKIPLALWYVGVLLREILKANRQVLRLVLSPREEPEPLLVRVNADLTGKAERVALANSITLTPGTITVKLDDKGYIVHCLDKDFREGIEDGDFVKVLQRIEGKK